MPPPSRLWFLVAGLLPAVVLAGLFPAPALACKQHAGSYWDWVQCYSLWRTAVIPGAVVVALWLWCYNFLFFQRYLGRAKAPLWPREAFWRATAWFLFLACASAVVIFTALPMPKDEGPAASSNPTPTNEWLIQWGVLPSQYGWLDRQLLWMSILAAGALLAFLLAFFNRHRDVAGRAP